MVEFLNDRDGWILPVFGTSENKLIKICSKATCHISAEETPFTRTSAHWFASLRMRLKVALFASNKYLQSLIIVRRG